MKKQEFEAALKALVGCGIEAQGCVANFWRIVGIEFVLGAQGEGGAEVDSGLVSGGKHEVEIGDAGAGLGLLARHESR